MPSKIAIAYQMKKKAKNCASGGTVESGDETMNYAKGGKVEGCPTCGEPQKGAQVSDVVDRVISKRMSKGGRVANDTQDKLADFKPNQFDDLVLRDDLEDTSGPGNEIGGPSKDDLVARAMLRKKAKR